MLLRICFIALLVLFEAIHTNASYYRGSCLKVTRCIGNKCGTPRYGNQNYNGQNYQAEPDEQVYVMVAVSQSIQRIRNRYPNTNYFGRPLCSNEPSNSCLEGEVIAYETTTALESAWSRRPKYTESIDQSSVNVGQYAAEQLYIPLNGYQFARWKRKTNQGYRMDRILTIDRWFCGWWQHTWADMNAGGGHWYKNYYSNNYKPLSDNLGKRLGGGTLANPSQTGNDGGSWAWLPDGKSVGTQPLVWNERPSGYDSEARWGSSATTGSDITTGNLYDHEGQTWGTYRWWGKRQVCWWWWCWWAQTETEKNPVWYQNWAGGTLEWQGWIRTNIDI